MNGMEKNIAISMSGLMGLNMTEEAAWVLIKKSDYCVGMDYSRMLEYLHDILNGGDKTIQSPSDLPEDLFNVK